MAIAKPLSVVAALAALAAAGLMIFSCLNQNFVAVEFGTVDACNIDETPIATVGVYQSTFDDSCLEGTEFESTYDVLGGKIESPTTEFFPLFPAQTGYGGLVEGVPEFTTCEEFYTSDELTAAAVTTAVESVVVPGAQANFASQYATFSTTVGTVFSGLPLGLNAFVAGSFPGGYNDTVEGLQEAATGAIGLLNAYNQMVQACAVVASVPFADEPFAATTSCADFCTAAGDGSFPANVPAAIQPIAPAAAAILCVQLSATVTTQSVVGIVTGAGSNAVIQATTAQVLSAFTGETVTSEDVLGLVGVIGLHTTPLLGPLIDVSTDSMSTVTPKVIGGVLGLTLAADEDFSAVESVVNLLNVAATSQGSDAFAVPANFFALCDGESSVANCTGAALAVNSTINLNSDDTFPVCVVAGATEDFNETSIAGSTDCTFSEFLVALTETRPDFLADLVGGILQGAEGLDLTVVLAAVPALKDPILGCAAANLTLTGCNAAISLGSFTAEENADFPPSWSTGRYALCNGLPLLGYTNTCDEQGSFRSFVLAVYQEAVAAATAAAGTPLEEAAAEALVSAGALNGLVNGVCLVVVNGTAIPSVIDNLEACLTVGLPGALALETKPADLVTLFGGLENAVYAQVGVNSTSLDQRIADCEDDEKDLEIFGQAQGMAAAATAAACLVALLSIVNIVKTGPKLSVVAGLLAVVAGAVLIGALLLVRTAPVYNLISDGDEAEVPGDLIYKASFVQLYALVACIVSVVAGVLLLVTACLSRGGSDEETDGKVATASY